MNIYYLLSMLNVAKHYTRSSHYRCTHPNCQYDENTRDLNELLKMLSEHKDAGFDKISFDKIDFIKLDKETNNA